MQKQTQLPDYFDTNQQLGIEREQLFFDMIQDELWRRGQLVASGPVDSITRGCGDHTLAISTSTLSELGYDQQRVEEMLKFFEACGAHCDCRVLECVAEDMLYGALPVM